MISTKDYIIVSDCVGIVLLKDSKISIEIWFKLRSQKIEHGF